MSRTPHAVLSRSILTPDSLTQPDEAVPRSDAERAFLELLERGDDGRPRRVCRALPADRVEAYIRHAAAEARRRGFVPVSVRTYVALRGQILEPLRTRTLLLIARPGQEDLAARALLAAAARGPRAHVLLQMDAPPERLSVVHEARARYGGAAAPLPRRLPADPDIQRERARAARARELAAAGRHAAGMRLLRDAAAALGRRGCGEEAARALITLGRLLLERGRAAEADRAFEEAAHLGATGGVEELVFEARRWQAAARIDAGRLTEGESICRAALASGRVPPRMRGEVAATLVRVLLWQDRLRDAAVLDADLSVDDEADLDARAYVQAMRVRLLVRTGQLFEAGCEAERLLARTHEGERPDAPLDVCLARIVALSASLRVAVSAGDLARAADRMAGIDALGRRAGTPLRIVRARLLLVEGLLRGGQVAAARRVATRVRRIGRAVPALLRRGLAQLGDHLKTGAAPERTGALAPPPDAARLVVLAHETEEDEEALRKVLHDVLESLGATRVDLWTTDEGTAPAPSVQIGGGLATSLAVRVIEAGVALGPEPVAGGRELGVPLRRGAHLTGAIVARWTIDRTPPPDAAGLLAVAAAAIGPRLEARQASARLAAQASTAIPELVGVSRAIHDVRAAIARAAAAPFSVLLLGESGVGKELAARAVHQLSPRRARPFSDVNCAAFPDDLLEAELFGHARGAFTGAVVERPGLLEAASGGTVFLDEIADLSARGQAKLLRVLQQQEVRRIGESFSRAIDVRLVAAANRDLHAEVAAGRFRADLLYRLDVIRLRIPPLRERPEDVAPLARHFWASASKRVGTRAALTHGVLSALARYHWPGNVRELQNVMAALAVAAPESGAVRTPLLPAAIAGATTITASHLADARAQFERRTIESALARAGGNRSRTARELGLSRQGLLKMMERLGISTPRTDV